VGRVESTVMAGSWLRTAPTQAQQVAQNTTARTARALLTRDGAAQRVHQHRTVAGGVGHFAVLHKGAIAVETIAALNIDKHLRDRIAPSTPFGGIAA
jgi:hypothetical protein